MGRFRKFWYLTRREKLVFVEACILLLAANLSVKILPFRHINSYLHHRSNRIRNALVRSDDIKNDINLVDLSLSRAANVLPCDSLCLSRSITKLIMLYHRRIPAVLFAGVKSLNDSSLAAHAWVGAGDCVGDANAGTENAEFAVLVRIGQEGLPNLSRNPDLAERADQGGRL
jgi:hypothetical protein